MYKHFVTLVQAEYDVRVSATVPSLHAARAILDTVAPESAASVGTPTVGLNGSSGSSPAATATPLASRPSSPPPQSQPPPETVLQGQ